MNDIETLTPPPSTNQDEYSDLDSQNSQAERRKYQRGGRKKGAGRANRIPPTPQDPLMPADEYDDPPGVNHSDEKQEPVQNDPDKYEPHVERPEICRNCLAKSREPRTESLKTSEEIPKPFRTGIRAFNMKRAAGSSGRPIGVRASSGKEKKGTRKQKKRPEKGKRTSSNDEEEMETHGSEEEEEDREKKHKPVSIRLDLNLVIEIFLKAKIQGDVTITFQ